jgi:hypothetical protein
VHRSDRSGTALNRALLQILNGFAHSFDGAFAKMQKRTFQERLNGLVKPFDLSKFVSKSVFATEPFGR